MKRSALFRKQNLLFLIKKAKILQIILFWRQNIWRMDAPARLIISRHFEKQNHDPFSFNE
jgi:hypothetical protein